GLAGESHRGLAREAHCGLGGRAGLRGREGRVRGRRRRRAAAPCQRERRDERCGDERRERGASHAARTTGTVMGPNGLLARRRLLSAGIPREAEELHAMPLMRARVNDRLARATRFPVTVLIAPAGFGKSVALRDFLETARLEAVRVEVARDDATLLLFARRLADALAPLAPDARAAFPAAQERIAAADDPVRELATWFSEHLKRAVGTVVVDDLHHAAADPRTVALVVALVERTAERIRWIVATRSDAGLPIASWVGYGRMDLPVGEDELLFTPEEALTGGWPVALGIALRARTHAFDLAGAASGTREMIYRYLAEQVFTGLARAQ